MANVYGTLELLEPMYHLSFHGQFSPPSFMDAGKKLRVNRVGPYTFEVRRWPPLIGTSVIIEGIVGDDAVVKEVNIRYKPRKGWQTGYVDKFIREMCKPDAAQKAA